MLFSEVKERLTSGENVVHIADELGIGQNKFRDILKLVGFEYESKQWFFRGKEAQLERPVTEYSSLSHREITTALVRGEDASNIDITISNPSSNPRITKSNIPSGKKITDGNKSGNTIGNPFTTEEVAALRKLARESDKFIALLNVEKKVAIPSQANDLRQKITENVGRTIKKTFVIEEQTAKHLDGFAERTGFAKSDLLTVAVQMLLEKYDVN